MPTAGFEISIPATEQSRTDALERAAIGMGDLTVLLTYLLTYLLTPWCRVLLEKLTGLQLVKKFPAFHGTRRFITALTSVRHLSLSWDSPIHSIYPHPTSWRSILILSTHLRLGLLSGLFPSGFPSKTLYTPLSSPTRATCPAHLILLCFITSTILGEEYRSYNLPYRFTFIKWRFVCVCVYVCVCSSTLCITETTQYNSVEFTYYWNAVNILLGEFKFSD